MNTPILKLRTALLVVLFTLSSSLASHAVAAEADSFAFPAVAADAPRGAGQIALAVIDGIEASAMTDEQKKVAIAEVAAAAALANPGAANAIGAAIADKYPALASLVASTIIHTLNDTGKSSYVSRQTMASLTTNNTAYINLHITEASWDQISNYSESTVNNPAMTRAIIQSASPN